MENLSFINDKGDHVIWCDLCKRQHKLPIIVLFGVSHDTLLLREEFERKLNTR